MPNRDAEIELDLSGLLCPLPVLRARKRLEKLPLGCILRIVATDPMTAIDMPHFCAEQGHELIEQKQAGASFIFRIRRK